MTTGQLPTVFLMGPTASGKTDLAVRLVESCDCDIVSVDSAMVYREMDIGTAKPTAEVLSRAPHRLIDIRDPAESYSVGDFRRDALAEIESIQAAGRIPLLAGGTMMYFHALEHGLAELPPAEPEIRENIEIRAAEEGWQALHVELARFDPETAGRIHPNDPQRIQRALEVFYASGVTMAEWLRRQRPDPIPGRLIKIALSGIERGLLHQRIEHRFELMMEAGFAGEVQRLMARGDLSPDMPSMRAVGYRQLWSALAGQYSLDEGVRRGIVATRRLAKRQFTWLRAQSDAISLDPLESDVFDRISKIIRGAARGQG